MTLVLGILLKIIVGAILLLLFVTGAVVPFILGKWFDDDLEGYYKWQRDFKRWELEDKLKELQEKSQSDTDDN